MKNNYWVGYQREGDTIEVILKDMSGRKLVRWEANIQDKVTVGKIFKDLINVYGLDYSEILNVILKREKNKDLDWLRRGS